MATSFKGVHYPESVILYAVYFYVRYAVSYRDLEEIMAERGVDIDHAALNRWVVKFSTDLAAEAQKRKRQTANSWRMDETYVQVKDQWAYLYRAVDTRPTLGFKEFHSAAATLAGIETAHMIRKGQIAVNGKTGFQQFASLAA
ncbi:IS6 family transposase [Celeribacter sp. ULVN23_4]